MGVEICQTSQKFKGESKKNARNFFWRRSVNKKEAGKVARKGTPRHDIGDEGKPHPGSALDGNVTCGDRKKLIDAKDKYRYRKTKKNNNNQKSL